MKDDFEDGYDGLPDNSTKYSPCTLGGVVALLIGKDGRVITNVSDFNDGSYGGFSLQESQAIRARKSLANSMMRELSSPLISESIDTYDAERIMNAVCSRLECRVEILVVGHKA